MTTCSSMWHLQGAGTFADPGPIGLKPMESFGSSYAGSMQDNVDPSMNGKLDMSPATGTEQVSLHKLQQCNSWRWAF